MKRGRQKDLLEDDLLQAYLLTTSLSLSVCLSLWLSLSLLSLFLSLSARVCVCVCARARAPWPTSSRCTSCLFIFRRLWAGCVAWGRRAWCWPWSATRTRLHSGRWDTCWSDTAAPSRTRCQYTTQFTLSISLSLSFSLSLSLSLSLSCRSAFTKSKGRLWGRGEVCGCDIAGA